jgi:hypothetical protein
MALGRSCSAWAMRRARACRADGGVAEPVGRAEPGELVDRLVEDVVAVLVGGRGGLLAWAGKP